MAKKVKKSAKPLAKKATPKKANAKPAAKKTTAKSASKPVPKKALTKASVKKSVAKAPAKKVAPKKAVSKPVAKKVAPKKAAAKPAPKKVVAKKVAPKKAVKKVASKPAAKIAPAKKAVSKPAPKKASAKSEVKKAASKKVASKPAAKPVAKKAVPKKLSVKPAVKKLAAKPVAKKALVKPAVKKEVSKLTIAKPVAIIKEDKSAKLALRRKKIQEIKNNYESPSSNEDDNYDDYRLPIIGRTRFSDAELNEFKTIINKKLAEAREELNFYQDQMKESEMNDDDIKFSGMEDGGHTNDKEHLSAMANRQIKFIQGLDAALIRIENKTYGICRMTGNLIDKKRLMAVPHATLSMEAKVGNKKR